jgi:radical S-adenosyl methionine domain-containing protein 2
MGNGDVIPSVNYHLWRTCNMQCRFCFATYDSIIPGEWRHGLPLDEARSLITLLGEAGFKKITFAGGEPTLCPWLSVLLQHSRQVGLKTAVVTNGSTLGSRLGANLTYCLDWLALSVDSVSDAVNKKHGRAIGGRRVVESAALVAVAHNFLDAGVRLKVNTVVTRLNIDEVLLPLIAEMEPERWKVMQVLEIKGENAEFRDLAVGNTEFESYVRRNSPPPDGVTMIVEENSAMTESYVMVDPMGRFIGNGGGFYQVSRPILQVGVHAALADVSYSWSKFERRGGFYDW